MLQTQRLSIIRLKRKIPQPLRHAEIVLGPGRVVIRLGALPPHVLQHARRQRPADLAVQIRILLREHVDVPDAARLVPRHEVRDPRLREDEALRAAAESGHVVHAGRDWEHGRSACCEEEGDEERHADAAEEEDGFVGEKTSRF